MRIKVQTLKSLLWLGNVLAFAAILGLLAHIFLHVRPKIAGKKVHQEIMAKIDLSKKDAKPSIEARDSGTGRSNSDVAILSGLNITGRDPPKVEVVDPTTTNTPPPMQPITEVVGVRYHVYSPNAKSKEAQIIYLADQTAATPVAAPPVTTPGGKTYKVREQPKTIPRPVKIGDKLRSPYDKAPFNAEVIDVTPKGVKFRWGAEEVLVTPALLPDDYMPEKLPPIDGIDPSTGGDGTPPAPPSDDSNVEKQPEPQANVVDSKALGENDWYIGTDELTRLEKEGEELLEQIELKSRYVKADGRTRLVLADVPVDSLAAQRGFKTDDILRKIDGQEMSSKSAIVNYFKANTAKKQYDIEIERLGTRITKSFKVAR